MTLTFHYKKAERKPLGPTKWVKLEPRARHLISELFCYQLPRFRTLDSFAGLPRDDLQAKNVC